MSLDVTEVDETPTAWVIRRNRDFKPLPELAKTDPKYPSLRVTPGINRDRDRPVRPVQIEYGKDLGTLRKVVEVTVPSIIEKEGSCSTCKEAAKRLLAHKASTDAEKKGFLGFGFLSALRPEKPFLTTFRENRPRLSDIRPEL